MSTVPRLPSAIDEHDANMSTMLAHQPELAMAFSELYASFWSRGVVDHSTKETVRIRNARVTDCGHRRQVRFAVAKQEGLDEAQVDRIDDGWDQTDLSERQKAALAFADGYLDVIGELSPPVREAFDREFTADEQDELGVGLALFHGFSKVLIALGCEPEEMDVTELPTPGS